MHATMPWYIKSQKVQWISTTFKTLLKSTALYFMSLVACNLLHEIRNHWYGEWRLELHWANPRTAGYSINPWATSCAAGNSSCIKMHATMPWYIKSQKVQWISTTFKTLLKSTALYFMSLVACNLLHEIRNRWYEEWHLELHWVNPRTAAHSINPSATSCAAWNLSCIKMHATMQQPLKRQKNPPHFILSPS